MKRILIFVLALALRVLAEPVAISGAAWSDDSRYLVTTGGDRQVRIHDVLTGAVLRSVTAPGEATVWFSFGPDSGWEEPNLLFPPTVSGDFVVAGGSDEEIYWWSLPDLKVVRKATSNYPIVGLDVAGGGDVMVCTSTSTRYLDSDFKLYRWVGETFLSEALPDVPMPTSGSSYGGPKLSSDGRRLVAWMEDQYRIWDLGVEPISSTGVKETGFVLPGNRYLYVGVPVGGADQREVTLREYEAPGVVVRVLARTPFIDLALDREEKRMVLLTGERLEIWDLGSEEPPELWTLQARGVSLSPDGKKVALWTEKSLLVGDLERRELLFELPLDDF